MAYSSRTEAPSYNLPDNFLASIEHPGVVFNAGGAIASLGGRAAIQDTFVHGSSRKCMALKLHQNDPYRQPIIAHEVPTTNVILKITTPKRTGRRRRKGTKGPFEFPDAGSHRPATPTTQSVIQTMKDTDPDYSVTVVGIAAETYRFRALPDFQYSLMSSQMAITFNKKILTYKVGDLQSFDFTSRRSDAAQTADMIPPPVMTPSLFPYLYGYNQNSGVKRVVDEKGGHSTINTHHAGRTGARAVHFDVAEVPAGPEAGLPPIETLDESVQKVMRRMQEILQDRPIFTRRALVNTLGRETVYDIKFASPYIVYAFVSGPWRDTLIRYGVDPRTSPDFRKYQTVTVKLLARADHAHRVPVPAWRQGRSDWIGASDPTSHIFDGKKLTRDGSTWQICDVTDPLLASILDAPSRERCDYKTLGWIDRVTYSKFHHIMREKIKVLLDSRLPDDENYRFVLDLPNDLPALATYLTQERRLGRNEKALAINIRRFADLELNSRRGVGRADSNTRRMSADDNVIETEVDMLSDER